MDAERKDDGRVETILYVMILVIGVFLIILASYQSQSFIQDLLLSLGTNMAVVTVIFLIFKTFRNKETQQSQNVTQPTTTDKDFFPEELRGKLSAKGSPRAGDVNRSYYEGEK